MKNKISHIYIFFSCIGLLFLIIGIVVAINYKNNIDNSKKISAIITDIKEYKVHVEYNVDGTIYNNVLNYYSNGMHIGKKIDIRYNLDNPNKIYAGQIFIIIIFSLLGFIFFMIGIIPSIVKILKNKKNLKLKQTGRKILAEIDCVEKDYRYSFNGRHSYIIKACYKDEINCKVYFFESNRIWFDAEEIIDKFNISTIPVYIDNNNFNKYFVDYEEIGRYIKNS